MLQAAWSSVRKPRSAPGVDGVTFGDIEESEKGVAGFLEELHEQLRSKRYRPSPVRRVYIPKPDGRTRPLAPYFQEQGPTVRDRVVQMAALLILEPIFEADFRDSSFGFRPGRSAHDALDAIRGHIARGKREIYDFVVLARYQGKRLRQWIETTLEGRFGLTINREKTRVVCLHEIAGEGLDFLGFTLRYECSVLAGSDRYLHVGPSRKAMQRVRDRLRELTSSRNCFKPASMIVAETNRYLVGWSQYFGYGHPRRAFAQVNFQTLRRLSRHLKRRSQRGSRPPAGRTLYAHLYDNLGLKRLSALR